MNNILFHKIGFHKRWIKSVTIFVLLLTLSTPFAQSLFITSCSTTTQQMHSCCKPHPDQSTQSVASNKTISTSCNCLTNVKHTNAESKLYQSPSTPEFTIAHTAIERPELITRIYQKSLLFTRSPNAPPIYLKTQHFII